MPRRDLIRHLTVITLYHLPITSSCTIPMKPNRRNYTLKKFISDSSYTHIFLNLNYKVAFFVELSLLE